MRVAIYCRLSKEDIDKQDESESIKNQKIMLTTYAMQNDWNITDYYIDDDFKGSDRDRPSFKRLIKEAKSKKFDIILCKSQARFARDLELVEKYLHGKFPEWGIRFISIVDRADTDDKSNKKSRQIIGLKDEWYLEDLSDDIRRVLNSKREAGVYIGSWALYGYEKDANQKGHLVIDSEAADIVREIYSLYLEGCGIQKIARILNDKAIDNPYLYKKKKGIHINEGRMTPKAVYWNVGAVYSILTNQIYTGDLVQGRFQKLNYKSKKLIRMPRESWYIKENTHEAIIDKDTFEMVQKMRGKKGRAIGDGTRHIFSGKVRCNECGQVMSMGRYPKNKKTEVVEYVRYLKCTSRSTRMESCIGSTIILDHLENHVIQQVNKLAEAYFEQNDIAKQTSFEDEQKRNFDKAIQTRIRIEKRISESKLALKNLYMDKVTGIINEDEFVSLKKNITDEKVHYQLELDKIASDIMAFQAYEEKEENRKDIINKYRRVSRLSREIVDELVEMIYVGHKDPNTGERLIRIAWTI